MEQATAHYWMLMKKKQHILNNNKSLHLQARNDRSWEERAFAEDAAGTLGGSIMWPPRSYSCSFCKREFRSAQALGGHMNVHRRDRARLKQSLSPHDHHNSSTSNHVLVASSSSSRSPLSPPRVSALALSSTTHENPSDNYHHLHAFVSSSSSSRRGHDDDIETDLSVGLNCSRAGDDQSMIMGCKRAKLAVSSSSSSSSLQFSLKPCFQAADMIGFKASSMEDLDLELRLGHDPPQVN